MTQLHVLSEVEFLGSFRFEMWLFCESKRSEPSEVSGVEEQLKELNKAVEQHYMKPLQQKRDQLESIQKLIEEGEEKIAQRKQELDDIQANLSSIQENVHAILEVDIDRLFPEDET